MTAHATDPRPMVRVDDVSAEESRSLDQFDRVVVEAPLAITVGEQTLVTTMRTPGHDEELAVGWLISEWCEMIRLAAPVNLAFYVER